MRVKVNLYQNIATDHLTCIKKIQAAHSRCIQSSKVLAEPNHGQKLIPTCPGLFESQLDKSPSEPNWMSQVWLILCQTHFNWVFELCFKRHGISDLLQQKQHQVHISLIIYSGMSPGKLSVQLFNPIKTQQRISSNHNFRNQSTNKSYYDWSQKSGKL